MGEWEAPALEREGKLLWRSSTAYIVDCAQSVWIEYSAFLMPAYRSGQSSQFTAVTETWVRDFRYWSESHQH